MHDCLNETRLLTSLWTNPKHPILYYCQQIPLLLVSAYNLFMMGRFKNPRLTTVNGEDYGRLFVNEHAVGQHVNSNAHASVINRDVDILLMAHSPPVVFAT